MKAWGVILMAIGLLGSIVALSITTTNEGTYNLGLLEQQELTFIAACTCLLAGVVIFAAGQVQGTVRRSHNVLRPVIEAYGRASATDTLDEEVSGTLENAIS